MMKIVLDTNVLVSGYLNPYGIPSDILARVASDELTLCYDTRIVAEYEEVLQRPEFDISKETIRSFLDQLTRQGQIVSGMLLAKQLPDPDDAPFLEVALAAQVPLVTGNIKDYPAACRQGVSVLRPSEFIKIWRDH